MPGRSIFEIRAQDALGRVGELRVPRAGVTVETPALLPVVNPNLITVDPARFPEFGAEMLITNSYIIHGDPDLRERAREEGLHSMLGFDGAIMTDSGSFQLAEYGEISVTTEEILAFQRDVGSDVGTPVDIPTPPDVERERAREELEETQRRLELAEEVDVGDMLVSAPVQGSTYPDLRERAARDAYATSLDIFPVGAVVPLLNGYRYADVVEAVLASKRGLGADAPVHLFGAGHPMTFALAAAAGCDLFDSAAYAIYARDDRYLTVRGTEHLDDMHYFPCSCPVCTEYAPDELADLPAPDRETRLAEHNLHVSAAELRRVRQAIRSGDLFELVEARAHGHPRLLDGYRALLDATDQVERRDPAGKSTFFYCSADSARRPEVARHHARLDRLSLDADEVLLVEPPAVFDDEDVALDGLARAAGVDSGEFDATWLVRPPMGPVPPALAHTYPASAEVPERMDDAGHEAAAVGVARLAAAHDASFTLVHRGWPPTALAALPDAVTTIAAGATDSWGAPAGGEQ